MGKKKGKGHVNLNGSHTSVIEGTESLLRAIKKDPLFDQVRPGILESKGGGVEMAKERFPFLYQILITILILWI